MVAESETDYCIEQAACKELVASAERWTSEGGGGCSRPKLGCPKAYLGELESAGFRQMRVWCPTAI
jgi:hypothetical protein